VALAGVAYYFYGNDSTKSKAKGEADKLEGQAKGLYAQAKGEVSKLAGEAKGGAHEAMGDVKKAMK